MNLYDLHDEPESLAHHARAHETVPDLVWEKYEMSPAAMHEHAHVFAKDPKTAFEYASLILNDKFPAGEAAIATSTIYSYQYALSVLKGPFKKGEDAIAESPEFAMSYARQVLKGPFKKGEAIIATRPELYKTYQKFVEQSRKR